MIIEKDKMRYLICLYDWMPCLALFYRPGNSSEKELLQFLSTWVE